MAIYRQIVAKTMKAGPARLFLLQLLRLLTAKAGSKSWSVQVNATKDQATADRLVSRLSELGYQAFIVRVRLADETWYRVRVGRFPTMEAATAVVMRLKNEERYSRAFLVNE